MALKQSTNIFEVTSTLPTSNAPVEKRYNVVPPPRYRLMPHEDTGEIIFEVEHALHDMQKRKLDRDTLMNVGFFLVLLGAGFGLVYSTSTLDPMNFMGGLLMDGGLTPFIISIWAFITGPVVFRKKNSIKMGSSLIVAGVGLLLLGLSSKEDIVSTLGSIIFETGALFFISKMFFMAEDDEMRIDRLEKQLAEAALSAGTGMALSYYYNFVVPTAANLNSSQENNGKTPVSMEVKRGTFVDYELQHSQLLIYVPRDLDGSDMKAFLRKITDNNSVIQGKPKDKPGMGSHRPMFVYFLRWNPDNNTCDALFDIPTIISSIWNRCQDQKKLPINPRQEILIFQNYLFELIQSNPITAGKVKIVSVPSMPFDLDAMKLAAEKLFVGELQMEIKNANA